jgi:hypothetical protein
MKPTMARERRALGKSIPYWKKEMVKSIYQDYS